MTDTFVQSAEEFSRTVKDGPFKGINAALVSIDSMANNLLGEDVSGDGRQELQESIKDVRQLVLRRIYEHWMDSENAHIEKVMGDVGLKDTEPRHWEMS